MDIEPPTPIFDQSICVNPARACDVRTPTESVAARIDSDTKDKLTLAAEECDVTVFAYLETITEEHIDRNPRGLQALESSATSDLDESIRTTREEPPNQFIDEIFNGLE